MAFGGPLVAARWCAATSAGTSSGARSVSASRPSSRARRVSSARYLQKLRPSSSSPKDGGATPSDVEAVFFGFRFFCRFGGAAVDIGVEVSLYNCS